MASILHAEASLYSISMFSKKRTESILKASGSHELLRSCHKSLTLQQKSRGVLMKNTIGHVDTPGSIT